MPLTAVPFPAPAASATPADGVTHLPAVHLTHHHDHPPMQPDAPVFLTAPLEPTGGAMSAFAVQVRRHVQRGQRVLVVDESACAHWPAARLLVLEHLRLLAQRCGCRWLVTSSGAAPLPDFASSPDALTLREC